MFFLLVRKYVHMYFVSPLYGSFRPLENTHIITQHEYKIVPPVFIGVILWIHLDVYSDKEKKADARRRRIL